MSLTKVTYSMIQGAAANVLDFGAVGDGATDDTAAIQAAIDSLSPNGGYVWFPVGNFKVTAQINIPLAVWKPVVLSGAGNATITSTHDGIVLNDSTGNIRVENLRFVGPGLSNLNSKAIKSFLSQGWIKGCYFNGYKAAIDIANSSGAVIDRNQFTLCAEGVRCVQTAPAFSNFAMIRNNWFDYCTYGCYFTEMYGVVLDNNAFEYNDVGFYAELTRLIELRGCNWFESNTTNAFQIDDYCTGQIGQQTRVVGNGYTIAWANSPMFDMLTPSFCIVNNAGTQSITHNVAQNLTWDTDTYDPANLHSTSVNPEEIVIKSTGMYEIVANLELASFATPTPTTNTVHGRVSVSRNGNQLKYVAAPMLTSHPTQLCLTTTEKLFYGDIIRMTAYQNTGSSLNATGGTFTQLSVRQLSTV